MEQSELVRSVLKSQYHGALAMLRPTIEQCPDELWYSKEYLNTFWQLAYHTLFFAHLYSQTEEAAFVPFKYYQEHTQYPDAIPGPNDPESKLPLIPDPFTREQVLEYWDFCDSNMNGWIDAMDIWSDESGFSWYKVPKLEHQIVNIRHIQHGAAQLADRLRSKLNVGVSWVGARRQS